MPLSPGTQQNSQDGLRWHLAGDVRPQLNAPQRRAAETRRGGKRGPVPQTLHFLPGPATADPSSQSHHVFQPLPHKSATAHSILGTSVVGFMVGEQKDKHFCLKIKSQDVTLYYQLDNSGEPALFSRKVLEIKSPVESWFHRVKACPGDNIKTASY